MFDIKKLDLNNILHGENVSTEVFQQKNFITAVILKEVMPNMRSYTADLVAAAINKVAPLYKLNSPGVFHEFIATCAEESGEFSNMEENLNYCAERLMAVFPKRFPTTAIATQYMHQPEKLGNYIYAGRMGNGDEKSGDGYKYRGRGPIQMTGHDMYASYAKYKGITIADVIASIATNMEMAIDSAMWVFVVNKGLLDEAQKDQFITITKAINGGTTNLANRQLFYARAKQYIA